MGNPDKCTTQWTCQSTDPVFSTLETSCLFTRKARWMASSALWGMLSASHFLPTGDSIWIKSHVVLHSVHKSQHLSPVFIDMRSLQVKSEGLRPLRAQNAASQEAGMQNPGRQVLVVTSSCFRCGSQSRVRGPWGRHEEVSGWGGSSK